MIYNWKYKTPKEYSNIIMNSDGESLIGLFFEDSKDSSKHEVNCKEEKLPIFEETCKWLDIYFSGKEPDFTPKYKVNNLTDFRKEVIEIMNTIPFGETITYNDIAKIIAKRHGIKRMSAQAVGVNGALTGYGGGIKNKVSLLKNEGNDISKYFLPKM